MFAKVRPAVLALALAASAVQAQAPVRVYVGTPSAPSYDGRHCALHPRTEGPLTLVVPATLPEATAPAIALLLDASGQVSLVDGSPPGTARLRDSTEPPDSDIAELGEVTTITTSAGLSIRYRVRYEGIACWTSGAADLVPLPPAEGALAMARALDLLSASLAMREIGRLRNAGDAHAALPLAERAYAVRRERLGDDNRYTLISLNRLGSVEWDLGEHRAAAVSLERAYAGVVATLGAGHPDAFGDLQDLALVHWDLGELERADRELRDALDGRRRVLDADDLDVLSTQFNLATLQGELGDLGESQRQLEDLFRIYDAKLGPDHPSTLLALNNLGYAYHLLGRYDDEYRVRTLACDRYVRAMGARHPATLRCLHNLGPALSSIGRKDEALVVARRAYEDRVEVIGAKHPETLFSMGTYAQALADVGDVEQGIAVMRRLLEIRIETRGPDHPETLQTYTVLARLQQLAHDFPAARRSAGTAFDAFDAARPRSIETFISLGRLASIEADMGERAAAIEHYQSLVRRVEERRRVSGMSAESQRAAFAVWAGSYRNLVMLLADRGATRAAFRQLELSKARGLLETLAFRRAESASGLSTDEQASLRVFERRIESLDETIARLRSDADAQVKAEAERSAAARELADLRTTLRERHPKYAQLTEPPIADADAARGLLATDTAFVSYVVHDNRMRAFVVDRGGEPRAFDLGSARGLADSVAALRVLLAPRSRSPAPVWRRADGTFVTALARPAPDARPVRNASEVARALGASLLDPLAPALAGRTRLVISPDGALALVPFEALLTARGRVLDRYRVSYVQSLSVLALVTERARQRGHAGLRRDLLGMGAAHYAPAPRAEGVPTRGANAGVELRSLVLRDATPGATQRAFDSLGLAWRDLPGAKREIETVGHLFGATPGDLLLGADATETRLRALDASGELATYRYLLFAAHGYLSTEAPALSALVLGVDPTDSRSDGYVTVAEWVGYRLTSDLVVLSACDTGVGREIQGEGVMGLPFALFVAGNRNAVISLWPVYDESTAEFMRQFFVRIRAGAAHADALTETKRAFARGPRYRDPAHWAGFVLYGN